jgi:hypothetical protein
MADLSAAYANKTAVMVSENVRLIFIDARQNVGRVAQTETVVGEIVMARANAQILAESIYQMLGVAPLEDEQWPITE